MRKKIVKFNSPKKYTLLTESSGCISFSNHTEVHLPNYIKNTIIVVQQEEE